MLITANSITKTFGTKVLFEGMSLSVGHEDRLGLIGPNGTGKSTLLKIMAQLEKVDGGEVARQRGAYVAYVGQASEYSPNLTVKKILERSLEASGRANLEGPTQISIVLSLLGFEDPEQEVQTLSGGWKKRLSIGEALVTNPDLILFDEPTNHMDWEGIFWLEGLLKKSRFPFVVVSHDRTFLENITNRIVEIHPVYKGGNLSVKGSYSQFLQKKAEYIEAQQSQQSSLANKLRRESEWLSQSPQARSTKSRSRIKAAYELGDQVQEIRDRQSKNRTVQNLEFSTSEIRSKKLLQVSNAVKSLGGKKLFTDLDLLVRPGDCWGILGLNGSGKTTLLKSLFEELSLDQGSLEKADGLKITYFDQNRKQLNLESTVLESLTGGDSDYVIFQGKSLHAAAYARRFLFQQDQFQLKVKYLSGGEKARLLMAQFMLLEADVLLFDEPTNDLDIETLEVLEQSLLEFPGGIVIVSHDRSFLEKIATHYLALKGAGQWGQYADFYQWENEAFQKESKSEVEKSEKTTGRPAKKKKLSYLEQKEWESIEKNIEKAEENLLKEQAQLESPTLLADAKALHQQIEKVTECQQIVENLYQRWDYLEAKREGREVL
ncbi:MAG: ABC-F family ATP-binding cassette domain-containing protein [Bdellovibrionales bacterium]|nr:ABC-F family ATP-binding cassette domain-containing protein [Bdellovibrionales bacterium]